MEVITNMFIGAILIGALLYLAFRRRNLKRLSGSKFSAAGKEVQCTHCGSTEFEATQVLMNSSFASIFGFDWADRHSNVLECRACGQVMWFSQNLEER